MVVEALLASEPLRTADPQTDELALLLHCAAVSRFCTLCTLCTNCTLAALLPQADAAEAPGHEGCQLVAQQR